VVVVGSECGEEGVEQPASAAEPMNPTAAPPRRKKVRRAMRSWLTRWTLTVVIAKAREYAGPMGETDWLEWHRPYDDPDSPLSARLAAVQAQIATALDRSPPGPIRVLSLCAGQSRDLLGVLPTHPRRRDVIGRLIDVDERNVTLAVQEAKASGVEGLEIIAGDAQNSAVCAGAVPAQVLLLCGVFGNLSDDDIKRTIDLVPMLCTHGAFVIWTRHRRAPDLTPQIRQWFADGGFTERVFSGPEPFVFGVGTHEFTGEPIAFEDGVTLFRFVGDGSLPA
jgi:hypothetical protein